jgi:hypothetical protein
LLEIQVGETIWPDGRVMLAITAPGQEHANLTEFMPVDDHWLPRPLIEAWPATLATWRARLTAGDREAQQRAKAAIAEFEASFDQMRDATTVEEFQAAAAPFLLKVYRTYHRWTQPAGPPGGVSITIRGRFNDDQQTKILADLEAWSDDPPRCVYTATANPDAMIIALRPVADVDAFAAKLTFGSDVEVDAENRTVTLTYRAP